MPGEIDALANNPRALRTDEDEFVLTVLFATRNRAELLRRVLDSYCALQPPEGGWKVVVIDNGSTDSTPEALADFRARLPLEALKEPKPGKNLALNLGLDHVEGDLVVFTDDDAFPAADWLVQLRKAADERPAYSMFGGAIVPRWEASPPAWVKWVNVGPVFTLTEPAVADGPMDPCDVFGPNMAVRASIFRAGVRFDTGIGPSGPNYAMGSETELVLRLAKLGHQACRVKDAVVEHFIRKEQLHVDWVLQRAVRFGRGQYRLFGSEHNAHSLAFRGVPLHLYRRALKQAVLAGLLPLLGRDEEAFRARWRLNVFRGQMKEARTLFVDRQSNTAPVYRRGPGVASDRS